MIRGIGEFDLKDPEKDNKSPAINEELEAPETSSLPYLILDVRDKDAFDQCHIIGGLSIYRKR